MTETNGKNGKLVAKLLGVAVAMFGFGVFVIIVTLGGGWHRDSIRVFFRVNKADDQIAQLGFFFGQL